MQELVEQLALQLSIDGSLFAEMAEAYPLLGEELALKNGVELGLECDC